MSIGAITIIKFIIFILTHQCFFKPTTSVIWIMILDCLIREVNGLSQLYINKYIY
jgi:hypothetical protein